MKIVVETNSKRKCSGVMCDIPYPGVPTCAGGALIPKNNLDDIIIIIIIYNSIFIFGRVNFSLLHVSFRTECFTVDWSLTMF